MTDFSNDKRFTGIQPLDHKVFLASPTMHGDERKYVGEAFDTNWVTTEGLNIKAIEQELADRIGTGYSVAIGCGTAALHLAIKLAGEALYGKARPDRGTLAGTRVFCTDVTFDASVNPVAYEDGQAVFIDSEYETWNMSPKALEQAFARYPDTRLIVIAHLYGTPARMEELCDIAQAHGALIVEDAAESVGATCRIHGEWVKTGAIGDYNAISFNGNKIITGSSGGMFLTNSKEDADHVRKWSTQSREPAPWYQHEEIGYNYRMSNIVAGVVRGQLPYLDEHIQRKKSIYERYRKGLQDLPVQMNPYDGDICSPNFWLSCMLIDTDHLAPMTRTDTDYDYQTVPGKTSPQEILDALKHFGFEGRPIWKPMHLQPLYREHDFITADAGTEVGTDIFNRGLCLPSDIKMTHEEQDLAIEIIHRCFGRMG